jgi:hypothetical protein
MYLSQAPQLGLALFGNGTPRGRLVLLQVYVGCSGSPLGDGGNITVRVVLDSGECKQGELRVRDMQGKEEE